MSLLSSDVVASARLERQSASQWLFLLAAAWALLVGVALALRPILPVDETRYLSVAWEMWVRGDFLVPHLNGLPYSDKPPLLFWLFHLGWEVFGVNDWWPRLVPSLFALANLLLAAALARRLWPDRPRVARAAPWVLLGLLLWSVFTTLVMFDMLVACCVLVALLGLHAARRQGGLLPWIQVGVALGLGLLAKGPVVFIVPLGVALLAPWWGRGEEPRGARGWRWALGLCAALALGAAIALAWALPAAMAGGEAYGNAILLRQTEERIVHSFAHRRAWWWYLRLLPVLLYPYSLWVPLWKAAGRFRRQPADPGMRFALAWALPGFAAFLAISGKQPHYLLPLLPGFALLAARLLDEPLAAPRRWHLLPPLSGLLIVGGAMAAAPFAASAGHLPSWASEVSPGAGLALLAAGVGFLLAFERLFARRQAALTLLTLALVTAVSLGFSEAAREAYDLDPISRYLWVTERQGRRIAYSGDYHGEFHFLGRLERPFEEILPGSEHLWILEHPHGRVIQNLHYLPPGIARAEFTQPYRGGDILAVWGHEGLDPAP
ncbi:MAG TPA: glycosyltransferase family 39 protein [Thermoanaerobaculia bacterium]|nr:glycosyltransferase family 39 protein [Thermoanaerobaculia bacterium]